MDSIILVTICLDAYDLDFLLTFVFAVSSTLRESILAFPSLTMICVRSHLESIRPSKAIRV